MLYYTYLSYVIVCYYITILYCIILYYNTYSTIFHYVVRYDMTLYWESSLGSESSVLWP